MEVDKEKKKKGKKKEKKSKKEKESKTEKNQNDKLKLVAALSILFTAIDTCDIRLKQLLQFKHANKISSDIGEQEVSFLRQQYIDCKKDRNIAAAIVLSIDPSIIISRDLHTSISEKPVWKIRTENFDTVVVDALNKKPKRIKFMIPEKDVEIQKFNKATRRYYLKYGLWIPVAIDIGKKKTYIEFHLIHGSDNMGVTEFSRFIREFCRHEYINENVDNKQKNMVENGYYATAKYSPIRILIENSSNLFDIIEPLNFKGAIPDKYSDSKINQQDLDEKERQHCGFLSNVNPPIPFDNSFSLTTVDDINIAPEVLIQYQKAESDLDVLYDSLTQDYLYNPEPSLELVLDQNGLKNIPSRLSDYNEIADLDILSEELSDDFKTVEKYMTSISLNSRLYPAPTREYVSHWKAKTKNDQLDNTRINIGTQELYMTFLSIPNNMNTNISQSFLLSNQICIPSFSALAELIKNQQPESSKKKRKESTLTREDVEELLKGEQERKAERDQRRIKGSQSSMRTIAAIKRSGSTWSYI